jgi:transcriptional regulator of met regulon
MVLVTISIPKDTLRSLKKVATNRDILVEALLKFYVGQGLRQDLTRLFSDRVLETTAQVLARHIQSEEEISAIIREIRVEVAG